MQLIAGSEIITEGVVDTNKQTFFGKGGHGAVTYFSPYVLTLLQCFLYCVTNEVHNRQHAAVHSDYAVYCPGLSFLHQHVSYIKEIT